jgi:hypothetical protein
MAREPQAAYDPSAQSEPFAHALEVSRSISRARQAAARSRRLPGLALLFLGTARGRVRTVPLPVPALPWSAGLSVAWLQGWAARGDGSHRLVEAASPRPAEMGISTPPEPRSKEAATPIASPRPVAAPSREQGREDAREPLPARSGFTALEAVAPVLVFLRGLRAAPHQEGPAGTGAGVAGALRRSRSGYAVADWGLLRGLRAARPVIGIARLSSVEPASDREARSASLSASASRVAGVSPVADDAPAARWSALPLIRAVAGPLPAGPATPDAVLPYAEPRLLQRDIQASPITVKSVVEVADSLRSFVAREVNEQVDRAVASRPIAEPARPASPPADEAARRMMAQMRTLAQEERFRSGKLR